MTKGWPLATLPASAAEATGLPVMYGVTWFATRTDAAAFIEKGRCGFLLLLLVNYLGLIMNVMPLSGGDTYRSGCRNCRPCSLYIEGEAVRVAGVGKRVDSIQSPV